MRLSFDMVVGTLAGVAMTLILGLLMYEFWFDRVEAYYPVKATVQEITYHKAHTQWIFNGKTSVPIHKPEEWEYYLKSDSIGGYNYLFWLTSRSDLGTMGVTVHYGVCRISKNVEFRW